MALNNNHHDNSQTSSSREPFSHDWQTVHRNGNTTATATATTPSMTAASHSNPDETPTVEHIEDIATHIDHDNNTNGNGSLDDGNGRGRRHGSPGSTRPIADTTSGCTISGNGAPDGCDLSVTIAGTISHVAGVKTGLASFNRIWKRKRTHHHQSENSVGAGVGAEYRPRTDVRVRSANCVEDVIHGLFAVAEEEYIAGAVRGRRDLLRVGVGVEKRGGGIGGRVQVELELEVKGVFLVSYSFVL